VRNASAFKLPLQHLSVVQVVKRLHGFIAWQTISRTDVQASARRAAL
jgi:hypothetical protein